MSARLAAIDIGTVTTRLLIADVSDAGISQVDRSTDITHLGEGLTAAGALSAEGMNRVADVISRYAECMKSLGVERYSAIATSASRDAQNAGEFMKLLATRGVDVKVITGSEEADLAFAGATFQTGGEGLLVVDSGGGSTELVFGDAGRDGAGREQVIRASRSIDVGSKRMTEMFLKSDPPTPGELDEARIWAAAEFRPFFERLDERPREMLGLAGTATTLAAIRMELDVYDPARVHGYRLSGADLCEMLDRLATMPLERRRQVVGLHPGRAGVIVAGTLIFETVLALAGLPEMIVSEHDILYGILMDAHRHLREDEPARI